MHDDWTELYRPSNLKEVLGNPKAVAQMRQWALAWEAGQPKERAIVLIGTPGIGKTSMAQALAKEFSWGLVEMNASDQRNAEAIRRVALRGALSDTFSDTGEFLSSKEGRLKLIVLDEADNIFGREDAGGIPAMAELIRSTRQPVILIVNDFYELSRRSAAIKSETLQIKLSRLQASTVKAALKHIAMDQGVSVDEKVFDSIAERSNGDMRAAIRDLQAVALGHDRVEEHDLAGLGDRLSQKSMYELMADVLGGINPRKARQTMMDADEDPDYIMKWLDENVPLVYKESGDLDRAYGSLSRADIFMSRVKRRQYYGFWGYANMHMCYGVTLAKAKPYRGYAQYRFPMMLLRLSRSKEARGVKAAVAHKIGAECHSSMRDTIEQILPYFRELFKQNQEFRSSMALRLALEQEEVAFILEQKVDAPAVKQLMAEMNAVRERGRSAPPAERIDEPEPTTKPERKGRKKKAETTPAPKVAEEPPPAAKEEKTSEEDKGTQKTLFQF